MTVSAAPLAHANERSTADGRDSVFSSVGNPDLPGELPTDVWNTDRVTAKA